MIMSCHISRRHAGAIRGIQMENNRDPDHPRNFALSDIDWSRTKENVYLARSDHWLRDIRSTLADHGIQHYRKNAVLALDTIYSASKEFFVNNDKETVMNYFKDCLQLHTAEFGPVLNSVVHFDERKPHMHTVTIPMFKRGSEYVLCARDMVGGKPRLYQYHDRLYIDVGKFYDLERGARSDSHSKKQHLELYQLKLFSIQEKIDFATHDLDRIKADIDRYGSVESLFTWANDIATKVDMLITALGADYSIEKIQGSVEMRGILLEKSIKEAGCHIEETVDGKYCFISDANADAVSWDRVVPLYVQDGVRLIPTMWALEGDQKVLWKAEEICREYRDPVESTPTEKLGEISDELDRLIDTIEKAKDNDDDNYSDVETDEDND